MRNFFSTRNYLIFIILITLLALVLRFYNLSGIPNGFSQDESAIGYNAYSIIQTGKDEHGIRMPLYFKSFGDYKLPVYVYLTVASIKIFGINEFAVRFPSAFFGTLTVLVLAFLVEVVTKRRDIAIISALLLALTPWHLLFSRSAFEVNVALFFMIVSLYCLVKAIKSRKNSLLFILSIVSLALSLYSYNVTRILSPLLFGLFIFYYRKDMEKINKKKIIFYILLCIIVMLPFVLTIFSKEGAASAKEVLIIGSQTQAKIVDMKTNLGGYPVLFRQLFFNKWVAVLWQYLENIVSYFSFPFFFTTGSSHGNQGIGNSGVLQVFTFPFIFIGFYFYIKEKMHALSALTPFFLWGVVTLLVASLSYEVPHATRGYFLVIPLTVFAAYGVTLVGSRILTLKKPKMYVGIIVIFLFFGYSSLYFLSSYFFRFPILYTKAWREEDKKLSIFLLNNQYKYDKIVIDNDSGLVYTSILFFQKFSPQKFQKTAVYESDNKIGYGTVKRFDKYEFRKIDWARENDTGRIIYIVGDTNQSLNKKLVGEYRFPVRVAAFSANADVVAYPVTDIAYMLYE